MRIAANIVNYSTGKKGAKITLQLNDEQARSFEPSLARYRNRPLLVDLNIDLEETNRLSEIISPEQRKKIYALIKEIAEWVGESVDSQKEEMKRQFCAATWHDNFSLSDCESKTATEFIEWLIDFCFYNGVYLIDSVPQDYLDDQGRYMAICLKHKKCAVCGRPGEVHHYTAIGMGRDRKEVDDLQNLKMCLCREHHSEAHQIGRESFCKKYHLSPIVYNE